MSNDFSRRQFFHRIGAGAAATAGLPLLNALGEPQRQTLPHRNLGGNGVKVPILAFGCGSRFLMYEDEDKALEALNHAIDLGITYLDTAYAYGDGKSETRVGKVMATRRNEVFLATKIPDRTRDAFMSRLEASLKRLQTDHVDLVHIHSLGKPDDLTKIEAPDGAIHGLLEAREQKMARFIGMTSHTDGTVMAQAIEHHPLNCVQMALNASGNGHFEEVALPVAVRKKLGVIAMKVTGQEFLLGSAAGKTGIDNLLRYSLSLPVSAAVIGMPQLDFVSHNAEIARNFVPLTPPELANLRRDVGASREGLEHRLVGHLDGPTSQGHVLWA
ncbi:MAG TPA: aldo/keto reductase [Terriglobia bacterium]|nr:aldo/keto reductase [Terriglobia bacterium]